MADLPISALPEADALTGTEVLAVVQVGATKKTTTQDVADLAAGGGAHPVLIVTLPSAAGFFDNTEVNDWGDATVVQASADAHFDNATNAIVFDTAGTYRISVRGRVEGSGSGWPQNATNYGAMLGAVAIGRHSRSDESAVGFMGDYVLWTDEGLAVVAAAASLVVGLYANGYSAAATTAEFSATVFVQRVSP